jgi:excinuclease UvrABC nuclease subunit
VTKRSGTWRTVDLLKPWELPQQAGVYAFLKEGRVIYIGSTVNIRDRFRSYGAARRRFDYDYDRATHFEEYRLPDRMVGVVVKVSVSRRYGDWLMRELRLIRRLNPDWNSKGRPTISR